MAIKAISSKSNVLYGITGLFKLDICALHKTSCVVHTNVLKTDIASVLFSFEPMNPYFNYEAGYLYYKDRSKFIEIKNEYPIISSLVQDGDTVEISTFEEDTLEMFQELNMAVNI